MKTAFILNFLLQVEICLAVTSGVGTPSYTATRWLHLTHIDKGLHASAGQVGSVLQGVRMTGSIAVSQCGHTPNRPGHHGTVVARTVGTVAISCNVGARSSSRKNSTGDNDQFKILGRDPEYYFFLFN